MEPVQGGGATRNPAFLIFGQDPQEHLFCFLPKPGQKSETSGLPLTCWVRRLLAQFSPVIIYEGWKSVPVVNERGNCRPAMNVRGAFICDTAPQQFMVGHRARAVRLSRWNAGAGAAGLFLPKMSQGWTPSLSTAPVTGTKSVPKLKLSSAGTLA